MSLPIFGEQESVNNTKKMEVMGEEVVEAFYLSLAEDK